MRGGAIPLLCWAGLLAVTGTLNAIWTGDTIQIATFSAAVLAILLFAAGLTIRSSQAVRRGPPARRTGPEAFTRTSFAAMFTAIGVGMLVFGFAFGHFPIYFGAGMIVVGSALLFLELRSQRSDLRAAETSREREQR